MEPVGSFDADSWKSNPVAEYFRQGEQNCIRGSFLGSKLLYQRAEIEAAGVLACSFDAYMLILLTGKIWWRITLCSGLTR